MSNQQERYMWDWKSTFLGRKTTPKERQQRAKEAARWRQDYARTQLVREREQFAYGMHYSTDYGVDSMTQRVQAQNINLPKTESLSTRPNYFKDEDITVEKTDKDGWMYSIKAKSMGLVYYIAAAPTGNCQIQSVYAFDTLCAYSDDDILLLLKRGWQGSTKKTLFLLDVKTAYSSKIKELFEPSEILLQTEYTNNTGSYMCIWLVQIQRMLERRGLV